MLTIDIEKIPLYQIGVERGIKSGKKENSFENAIIMIEKFKLYIDDIVRELNLKKEELLEYMQQKKADK